MTHRPNAMTRTREYIVLPEVVRHTFIIFCLFTTPNLCPWHKILATPLHCTISSFSLLELYLSLLSLCLSLSNVMSMFLTQTQWLIDWVIYLFIYLFIHLSTEWSYMQYRFKNSSLRSSQAQSVYLQIPATSHLTASSRSCRRLTSSDHAQVFISPHTTILLPEVNIFTHHGIPQHTTSTRSAILLYNRVGACIGRWRWRWVHECL